MRNPLKKKTLKIILLRLRNFRTHRKALKNKVSLISTIPTVQSSIVNNIDYTIKTFSNNKTFNSTLLSLIESKIRYRNFNNNSNTHFKFQKKFPGNPFDFLCGICNRL